MFTIGDKNFGTKIFVALYKHFPNDFKGKVITKEQLNAAYNTLIEKFQSVPFVCRGVSLNAETICKMFELSMDDIRAEKNVEKLRILIMLYGIDRFLNEGGAKIYMTSEYSWDYQDGMVYSLKLGDDIIYILKLINQTKEQMQTLSNKGAIEGFENGAKIYWLPIPQPKKDMLMLDIVGQTWGFDQNEYIPDVET